MMRYVRWVALCVVVLAALFSFSYLSSRNAAKELVGKSLDYCELTESKITIEPAEKNQTVWSFKFSVPGSFDEEFYVFTTLWGDVAFTNPIDIEKRLRSLEASGEYPYPKLKKQ